MENTREELDPNQAARFREAQVVDWTGTDFRPDLAFPKLTEEMVERLTPFGHEETFPADETLYTCGDRHIDMFVVLEGAVDIFLPASDGGVKIYRQTSASSTLQGSSIFLTRSELWPRRAPASESRLLRIEHNTTAAADARRGRHRKSHCAGSGLAPHRPYEGCVDRRSTDGPAE